MQLYICVFPFLKVHCKYYWLFIRDWMFSMIYIFRSSGGKLVLLENSMRTKKWYLLCELQGLHMLPKILYFYKTLPAMVECITSDNEKCQRLDSRLSFLNSKIWTIKVNDNHKYISNVCVLWNPAVARHSVQHRIRHGNFILVRTREIVSRLFHARFVLTRVGY